jgi:two-component sensor histidine kinase
MRADPRHHLTQIVVRTGEPGAYPEARIIEDFHISDYWPKTELSAARMRTCVVGLVRSHETARRLELQLGERETLLREMHHRVKNNLQILSSLLSLQARSVDEGARLELQHFAGRIRSMALVHQQLYGHESLTAIDFAHYLSGLAREVAAALGHEAVIRCHGDTVRLGVEVAIPAGLILNEVLTNAARHGRSADGVARVDVTLTTLPDRLVVAVRDHGPGHAPASRKGGLGGRLIEVLARQIRADLTRRVDEGMHVTLAIPLPSRG